MTGLSAIRVCSVAMMRWCPVLGLVGLVAVGMTVPSGTSYATVLYPSVPVAKRLAVLDDFWRDWKRTYLREGCGGAFVDTSGDGKRTWGGSAAETLTVSEAHGYGMLALVQMAPRDPSAEGLFRKMRAYYLAHPAASGPGLLAWNQTRDCADAPDGGDSSASDGDLDIALALQRAQALWGGPFGEDAARARSAILAREVSGDNMMRLGDWATDDDPYAHASRSSDFMPASFAAFAKAGGPEADRWMDIRDRGYAVWGGIARRYSPSAGLVPDFIDGLPDAPHPVAAGFLEGPGDGQFSWNALRYLWRLGLDVIETGSPRARTCVRRTTTWIREETHGDPMAIATTYRLDGSIPPDQTTGSGAFIAMVAVGVAAGGMAGGATSRDQRWLDALWNALVSIPVEDEDYYGNTLKLLSMIALSGLWTSA